MLLHASGLLNHLKSTPSHLAFIHPASGYQLRLGFLIKLAQSLALMLTLVIVIIYRRTKAIKAFRSLFKRNKPSKLALIGLEVSERQERQWSI